MSGVSRVIAVRNCSNCSIEVEIRHKDRMQRERVFCSKKCEGEYKKKQGLNATCIICNKKIHVKPSQRKDGGNCCSVKCSNIRMSHMFKGSNNHQYGIKGRENGSWKSDEKITNYGYRKIRVLNHPFRDCDDFVFEHRLVIEREGLKDEDSITVEGVKYLNPDLVVHHMDGNRLNNKLNNLLVLERDEHTALHSRERKNLRME